MYRSKNKKSQEKLIPAGLTHKRSELSTMDMSKELLYFYKETKAEAGVLSYRSSYFSRTNVALVQNLIL